MVSVNTLTAFVCPLLQEGQGLPPAAPIKAYTQVELGAEYFICDGQKLHKLSWIQNLGYSEIWLRTCV